MDLVKLKISWPTNNSLMMSLNKSCDKYLNILKYTNFILSNDSELDKEEKIKMLFFTFIFIWLLGKLDKKGTVKQINKKTLA